MCGKEEGRPEDDALFKGTGIEETAGRFYVQIDTVVCLSVRTTIMRVYARAPEISTSRIAN